jgi:hypothetical protein
METSPLTLFPAFPSSSERQHMTAGLLATHGEHVGTYEFHKKLDYGSPNPNILPALMMAAMAVMLPLAMRMRRCLDARQRFYGDMLLYACTLLMVLVGVTAWSEELAWLIYAAVIVSIALMSANLYAGNSLTSAQLASFDRRMTGRLYEVTEFLLITLGAGIMLPCVRVVCRVFVGVCFCCVQGSTCTCTHTHTQHTQTHHTGHVTARTNTNTHTHSQFSLTFLAHLFIAASPLSLSLSLSLPACACRSFWYNSHMYSFLCRRSGW